MEAKKLKRKQERLKQKEISAREQSTAKEQSAKSEEGAPKIANQLQVPSKNEQEEATPQKSKRQRVDSNISANSAK